MDNIILWIMAIAMVLGAAARAGRPDVPVDAAIVAILDETEATHG